MIEVSLILMLAFGFADLGKAEGRHPRSPQVALLAAVDGSPRPESSLYGAAAMDQLSQPKALPGLRPAGTANPQGWAPRGNPLWAVPITLLSVTRERPIFSPSRRPPAPVALVAVVEAPRPPPVAVGQIHPNLSLVGTVASEKEGIGVFLDLATNNVVRLRTGQGHSGWILRAVRLREVDLQNGELMETLTLPPTGFAAAPELGIPRASVQ